MEGGITLFWSGPGRYAGISPAKPTRECSAIVIQEPDANNPSGAQPDDGATVRSHQGNEHANRRTVVYHRAASQLRATAQNAPDAATAHPPPSSTSPEPSSALRRTPLGPGLWGPLF